MAKFILALVVLACGLLVVVTALPQRNGPEYSIFRKDNYVSPRIVGGNNATEGELPYQISIQVSIEDVNYHICGGSLIEVNGKQLVITAAHCFWGQFDYHVVAGSIELSHQNRTGHAQTRPVAQVILHEEYSDTRIVNDIALLLIDQPFELNKYVQPIPLPKRMQGTTGDVVVSGWGMLYSEGPTPDNLQKVRIPIIDDATCNRAYDQKIAPSMLCAGLVDEGGKDACQGDSGGPLKADNGGYLAGIVSWGEGCALPGYPGVYTETSHFIDWIDEMLYYYYP